MASGWTGQRLRFNIQTLFKHCVWTHAPWGVQVLEHLLRLVLKHSVWTPSPRAVDTRLNSDFLRLNSGLDPENRFCAFYLARKSSFFIILGYFWLKSTKIVAGETMRIFLESLRQHTWSTVDIDIIDVVFKQCLNTSRARCWRSVWTPL